MDVVIFLARVLQVLQDPPKNRLALRLINHWKACVQGFFPKIIIDTDTAGTGTLFVETNSICYG